jgi:hypothetical protein
LRFFKGGKAQFVTVGIIQLNTLAVLRSAEGGFFIFPFAAVYFLFFTAKSPRFKGFLGDLAVHF